MLGIWKSKCGQCGQAAISKTRSRSGIPKNVEEVEQEQVHLERQTQTSGGRGRQKEAERGRGRQPSIETVPATVVASNMASAITTTMMSGYRPEHRPRGTQSLFLSLSLCLFVSVSLCLSLYPSLSACLSIYRINREIEGYMKSDIERERKRERERERERERKRERERGLACLCLSPYVCPSVLNLLLRLPVQCPSVRLSVRLSVCDNPCG